MKPKFPYDTVETEDKEMGMFSRKDMVRLFGPLLVEQLLAVLVGMADVVMVAAVGETAVSGWWIPLACWSFRYYRPWLPEVQWSVLNT